MNTCNILNIEIRENFRRNRHKYIIFVFLLLRYNDWIDDFLQAEIVLIMWNIDIRKNCLRFVGNYLWRCLLSSLSFCESSDRSFCFFYKNWLIKVTSTNKIGRLFTFDFRESRTFRLDVIFCNTFNNLSATSTFESLSESSVSLLLLLGDCSYSNVIGIMRVI